MMRRAGDEKCDLSDNAKAVAESSGIHSGWHISSATFMLAWVWPPPCVKQSCVYYSPRLGA
jgi:hypothetical protein